MMAGVECWPAAARMLDYLESSGAFGDSATLRTIVADAATAVAAAHTPTEVNGSGRDLDDRQALTYMHATLTDLLARLPDHHARWLTG